MRANIAALTTLRTLRQDERPATPQEQTILARWSGWGAVPEVLDKRRREFAWARASLQALLSDAERAAAERNTLNAHYTDFELVTPIWSALQQLGFTGGSVLEPGCGSGNFIALAPPGAQMVGIEVEPVTAGIAAALYPDADIRAESFADTRARDASFDLVVGNVPFAKVVLHDALHNRAKHSIHNHFILKALRLTAPGGLVAVITSRYTLDAANPAARREMAQLADLVGAIRLPESAHQRAAGTRVVTDLVVLRRRAPDVEPRIVDWESAELADIDGHQVRVNSYFLTHPQRVCGRLEVGRGQYSDGELTVSSDQPAPILFTRALDALVDDARTAGLTHSPTREHRPAPPVARLTATPGRPNGYLVAARDVSGDLDPADDPAHAVAAASDSGFAQVHDGQAEPFSVPRSQRGELRALLGLRDTVVALLEAEASSADATPQIDALRTQLGARYDAYLTRHGPLNRFTWRRTGRTHPETGEQIHARIPAKLGGFRADPAAPLVLALEHFDPATQRASKADIFGQRVIAPRTPPLGADSPADALAICLDLHGQVDLGEIARLLGIPADEARSQLGELVFADPVAQGQLVPAAEYLSGQVRHKLAAAQAAAQADPLYAPNVAALAAVVPVDLAPEEIVARLGASWIEERYVQQFLQELLEDPSLRVEHGHGASWTVKGRDSTVLATSRWGTERIPAPDLAATLLAQRPVTVYDEIEVDRPDGGTSTRRVLNTTATIAAQGKAEEIATRFTEWIWEDPQRCTDLARIYNDRFNSLVLRTYDDVELSLPGMALTFRPNPHQVAAAARMRAEPAVGLYHEVGAGKTAEMAMGVMELRRLGLARKPAMVVPNHMLEQFTREFQQLYPQAKLLAASGADLVRDRRRAFVARIATGDWDAVIMTRGAFERIPMSPDAQSAYLDAQLEMLREAIDRQSARASSMSLKRMQRALQDAEEKIKAKLDHEHDPAITFEHSGIDYLVIDEAHDYKNLRTTSNIPGAAIDGSIRASDLDMKLHHLRARHGHRVVTLATATPIANSITEAHVMQRYLRPDLLTDAGVLDFDTWAATFGETTTQIEMSVDTASFRPKTRFARFHNVPELLRMWWLSGDVKTAEDLNLPRPELLARPHDGQRLPQTIPVPPARELTDFVTDLSRRADQVSARAQKGQDNMLSIASDGRAAALDLRLVGTRASDAPPKVEVAADHIAQIWARHRNDLYTDPTGRPHPVPGALQLVFCDLSTPRENRWNVYHELRAQLVARGLPIEQIRFIHDARNDRDKAELFEACRTGQVSVLIGSTAKMGVGTNVQARAIALHHLDCPWRPADLAQRDGRALRRGNQNAEIGLYRYVTEGSFDAYSWQTVARKAAFIAQLMRGRLDVREIEDIGDTALQYNEIKAIAAGNPLLLDKAQADADLTRLDRLERAHHQTRARLRHNIEQHQQVLIWRTRDITALQAAIARRTDTRGDNFSMTVAGQIYTDRSDADHALRQLLVHALSRPDVYQNTSRAVVELGGLTFDVTTRRTAISDSYDLTITNVPDGAVGGTRDQLLEDKPTSLPRRLENRLVALDRQLNAARQDLDECRTEIANAENQLERPFNHADDLAAARLKVAEIDSQINDLATPETSTDSPDEDTADPPPDASATADSAHPAQTASSTLRPDASASPAAGGSVLPVPRGPGPILASTPAHATGRR